MTQKRYGLRFKLKIKKEKQSKEIGIFECLLIKSFWFFLISLIIIHNNIPDNEKYIKYPKKSKQVKSDGHYE